MSSCFSGGRAYGLELEIIKSPSTSWISHSSSPSSTLSESSNSPVTISTRKPRTPRKRPNQTYNEAATILSTAYPKVFPTKNLTKPWKFTKPEYPFSKSQDLLLHFQVIDNSGFLLHPHVTAKPNSSLKMSNSCEKPCPSPGEVDSRGNSSLDSLYEDGQGDFDAESIILDEEIEEGIDGIMGKLSVENDHANEPHGSCYPTQMNTCYGYPIGLGFGGEFNYGYGIGNGIRAMRNFHEGEWLIYPSPSVNVHDITPKFDKTPLDKKKKKVEKPAESKNLELAKGNAATMKGNRENSAPKEEHATKLNSGLLLKLDYDNIMSSWSDRGSPFEEIPGSEAAGNDVQARLAQIDLFSENGGVREASVLRYKEKRRTRLFSKKIRYQVRKVNADQRPRMKGRFVKSPNSPDGEMG